MIIHRFTFNAFGVNTYILIDPATRRAAIIDPGMASTADCLALSRFISDNGLIPVHLINTHLHIDHTFGDEYISSTYSLPLEAHSADAILGRQRDAQARAFGIATAPGPLEIGRPLADGDTITVGNSTLSVISVPGHSPGSIALYDPADNLVITGDALFRESIGRTDLALGDHATLLHSVKSRLLTLPPETVVYPGHGPTTTIAHEARQNPFLN